MSKIVPEGGERAMNVSRLAALAAIIPGELGAAVQAGAMARLVRFARLRLDRAGHEPAADRLANPLDPAHEPILAKAEPTVEAVRSACRPC
ncbi:hypothetical protein [Sphingosinicella ginsenosidimutans]|uniref:hypothetical protein n=1 Tax=Allosphingosinicella ginsenosidimutans TaxID=1176539 RepID=UPI001FB0E4EE|nr:hypothetical protein [Sphingosinicella ginsenosidimutans]